MKSDMAKVLHPVGGKALVVRSVAIAEQLNADRFVVVIGRDADTVRQKVQATNPRAECVVQGDLLGTGHAVLQAAETLRGKTDLVAVFYADMPLLRADTMKQLVAMQQANSGPITMLTITVPDPRGFGRVLRTSDGNVVAIVEEKECTPEQLAIRELNVGVYVFRADWLWAKLPLLKPKSKGEYYLTDLVEMAVAEKQHVASVSATDPDEVIGINTRVHLAEAEVALRRRVNTQLMLDGVTIMDPATTYIHEDVRIGQDTVIFPNTTLSGTTVIGAHSLIGPNSVINSSNIGARCEVKGSVVDEATLEDEVRIGPYAHLRKGAYLCKGVHMGNFGEVKNSRLGPQTRMGHFSYIGDSEVGEDVNIGAGTITCNYDGVRKHKTEIGDHAFIGSDTMLVAPVTVEANARTAAGSVVRKRVPSGFIAVGVPARLRPITPPKVEEK